MNATAQKNDRMLTAAPPRLILSLSLPATAALLISAACGILDAWPQAARSESRLRSWR